MPGIFQIVLRLQDQHVFMWQSVEILNIFNTSTLKQIFWKTKTFSEKLEYHFLVESTKMKGHYFHTKLPCQKQMLRQTELWVQNGPITNNRVLPVTTLFFWRFSFSLRTSYKELIWCTNNSNAQIHTFCKRWSFIWQCCFLVSILKQEVYWKEKRSLFHVCWPWKGLWQDTNTRKSALVVYEKTWYSCMDYINFFLIRIHSMQDWTANTRYGVTWKRST